MAVKRLVDAAASAVLRFGVVAYRVTLGPFLGGHCRFHPTCSQYALDAVAQRGPWVGAWLIVWRLLRCQPFGGRAGFDPVPPPAAAARRAPAPEPQPR